MVTLVIVHDFDLLVIGSGPGGQKAAIAAAKLDRHVGIIEKPNMMGGVWLGLAAVWIKAFPALFKVESFARRR